MNLYESGWVHEDDNGDHMYATPHEALIGYLRSFRGSCDDHTDDREIEVLNETEQRVVYMEETTLVSEEHRDAELVGLGDEKGMLDLPIGGRFYRETKSARYVVKIDQQGDEELGTLSIAYARKKTK